MDARRSLPPPARERGRIAPIRLAHVVMRTSRYRKMVDWYRGVLEAEASYANEMITFLTYDEEHHRIAIANVPLLLPHPRFLAGVEHIAFSYATLGDLLATYRRLRGGGIAPYWCINHGGTLSMYYADPDGNLVELQVDNFEKPEDLNEFLYGPAFAANPIGVDFDPEQLCARYEAGESHAELARWREVAPRGPETLPVRHLGRLHAFLARLASRRRARRTAD
jgi:catechol 2,3-dioxygenase-like lactoylglutathione lyase family enzyme